MKDKISISVATLLPGTAVPIFGTMWLKFALKVIGLNSVQALPLRGMFPKLINGLKIQLAYAEDAWNPGTLTEYRAGATGPGGKLQLHDVLFFPEPQKSNALYGWFLLQGAIPVVHSVQDLQKHLKSGVQPCNLELHEGLLDATINRLPDLAGYSLTLDTKHLLLGGKSGKYVPLGAWEPVIDAYSEQITQVHLQELPTKGWHLSDIMLDVVQYMLKVRTGDIDWTVELNPNNLSKSQLLNSAYKLRMLRQFVTDLKLLLSLA